MQKGYGWIMDRVGLKEVKLDEEFVIGMDIQVNSSRYQ